ncbi:MAG: hypothetical protein ACXWD4_16015, partial [Bacteroidia bacterium]
HSEHALKVYVSFDDWNEIEKDDFLQIEETYSGKTRKYLIGNIPLETLQNADWVKNENVSLIVVENE